MFFFLFIIWFLHPEASRKWGSCLTRGTEEETSALSLNRPQMHQLCDSGASGAQLGGRCCLSSGMKRITITSNEPALFPPSAALGVSGTDRLSETPTSPDVVPCQRYLSLNTAFQSMTTSERWIVTNRAQAFIALHSDMYAFRRLKATVHPKMKVLLFSPFPNIVVLRCCDFHCMQISWNILRSIFFCVIQNM